MSCDCNKEGINETGIIGLLKVIMNDENNRTFIYPVREFVEHGSGSDFDDKLAELKEKYDDEFIVIDKTLSSESQSYKYIESEEISFLLANKAKAYVISSTSGDTVDRIF